VQEARKIDYDDDSPSTRHKPSNEGSNGDIPDNEVPGGDEIERFHSQPGMESSELILN
jgi:hypothetical protein